MTHLTSEGDPEIGHDNISAACAAGNCQGCADETCDDHCHM